MLSFMSLSLTGLRDQKRRAHGVMALHSDPQAAQHLLGFVAEDHQPIQGLLLRLEALLTRKAPKSLGNHSNCIEMSSKCHRNHWKNIGKTSLWHEKLLELHGAKGVAHAVQGAQGPAALVGRHGAQRLRQHGEHLGRHEQKRIYEKHLRKSKRF